MSAQNYGFDSPPFQLGETLKGLDSDGVTLINTEWVGRPFTFRSANYSSGQGIPGPKGVRSGRGVTAIICRNVYGTVLLGKRLGLFDVTNAGVAGLGHINGYGQLLNAPVAGVIDEFLPSTGVPVNDLFWLVVEGPVLAKTPAAGAGFNGDIALGAPLVCATAAGSTTDVAGRVSNATLAAQTAATVSFQQAIYRVGRALSARTTGETDADILINTGVNFF